MAPTNAHARGGDSGDLLVDHRRLAAWIWLQFLFYLRW
jgi:hypothetical protein